MVTTVPSFRRASTPWIAIEEVQLPPNVGVPAHDHGPPHVLVMLAGSLEECNGDGQLVNGPRSIRYSPGGDQHSQIRIGPDGAHCLIVEARGFPELRLVARMCLTASDAHDAVIALEHCLHVERCASPAAVEECALALFSLVRARTRAARVVHYQWIARARRYLDALAVSRSPLADTARHVRRNPSVVARLFRATYGVSVHRYYRRRQLDRAWSLLATTTLSLGTIALRCGFTDQSHMTRVFVREAGSTPALIRGRMRAGVTDAHHWYRSTLLTPIHS